MIDDVKEKVQRAFTPTHWVILILGLALIFGLVFLFSGNEGGDESYKSGSGLLNAETKPRGPTAEELEAARQKQLRATQTAQLRAELVNFQSTVNLRLGEYERILMEMKSDFLNRLPLLQAEGAFQSARDGVDFLASREGLCGFKTCVSLAYKIGYDKLKGTTKTEEALAPVIREHVEVHLSQAIRCYALELENFQNKVIAARGALQSDLLIKCEKMETLMQDLTALSPETMQSAEAAIASMKDQFREIAKETAYATIGVALEAIFIKATVQTLSRVSIRFLVPIFARTVARLGASAAAAGTAAVVDGPLPIGDIVGAAIMIGGSVWTAVDIYKVTKKMPAAIRTNMNAMIDDVRGDLLSTSRSHMERLVSACREEARALSKQLGAKIKEQEAAL